MLKHDCSVKLQPVQPQANDRHGSMGDTVASETALVRVTLEAGRDQGLCYPSSQTAQHSQMLSVSRPEVQKTWWLRKEEAHSDFELHGSPPRTFHFEFEVQSSHRPSKQLYQKRERLGQVISQNTSKYPFVRWSLNSVQSLCEL